VRHILVVVLNNGEPAPSQKAGIKDDQHEAGAFCLLPQESHEASVVAGDAGRDLERRLFMVAARHAAEHQPLVCGTSTAGVPRTYRIVPVKRRLVLEFLDRSATRCGGLLNSVMVLAGDKLRLYKTGQYRSDTDEGVKE
jgi:D-serine deaminase-like pyridoxal phosphate-dependent protein